MARNGYITVSEYVDVEVNLREILDDMGPEELLEWGYVQVTELETGERSSLEEHLWAVRSTAALRRVKYIAGDTS